MISEVRLGLLVDGLLSLQDQSAMAMHIAHAGDDMDAAEKLAVHKAEVRADKTPEIPCSFLSQNKHRDASHEHRDCRDGHNDPAQV